MSCVHEECYDKCYPASCWYETYDKDWNGDNIITCNCDESQPAFGSPWFWVMMVLSLLLLMGLAYRGYRCCRPESAERRQKNLHDISEFLNNPSCLVRFKRRAALILFPILTIVCLIWEDDLKIMAIFFGSVSALNFARYGMVFVFRRINEGGPESELYGRLDSEMEIAMPVVGGDHL